MTRPQPHVDYESQAGRYRRGRELDADQRTRWTAAIGHRLPDGPLALVVDAGAGTGAFLPVWRDLGAERIVAVEPSPAMRAEAQRRDLPGVEIVAGDLSSLPLPDATVDLVWISAVLHHVPDRAAALVEVARALRPGGHLLVRGLVPGSSRVPWLDRFPGADRSLARFPDADEITDLGRAAGLGPVAHDVVVDSGRSDPVEIAAWVEAMRHADSLLTALTDDEVAAGLDALRAAPTLDPVTLTLITLTR